MEVPTISVVLGGLENQKATANPSRTSKPVMVEALMKMEGTNISGVVPPGCLLLAVPVAIWLRMTKSVPTVSSKSVNIIMPHSFKVGVGIGGIG